MDLRAFEALCSPAGSAALEAATELEPVERNFLRDVKALSRAHPHQIASAALETVILRRRAIDKFGDAASRLFFTREALEQATPFAVARYRAGRFADEDPHDGVIDLGCSIGGDTLAFAADGYTVGVERDPLRLAMAKENASVLGLGESTAFVLADLTAWPFGASQATRRWLAFVDPSRRRGERRARSVTEYSPAPSHVAAWCTRFAGLAAKVSPAVDRAELEAFGDAELEFISLGGELKEGVLWFGSLRTRAARRATVLPGPHSLVAGEVETPGVPTAYVPTSPPADYLYEPDPAVMRAQAVRTLGVRLGATQIDPDIAYLTATRAVETPFARMWMVEDWMPFSLRRLRLYLRERGVGRVTIAKRGSPVEVPSFVRKLRLRGDEEKRLVLTHHDGRPIVIVCRP